MTDGREISVQLADAGGGDRAACDRPVRLVYPDLKRLAKRSLRGDGQLTLNITALVNAYYLRPARHATATI